VTLKSSSSSAIFEYFTVIFESTFSRELTLFSGGAQFPTKKCGVGLYFQFVRHKLTNTKNNDGCWRLQVLFSISPKKVNKRCSILSSKVS